MKQSKNKDTRISTFKDFVGELTITYKRTSLPTVKIKWSKDLADFARPYFDTHMDNREEARIVHLNRNNEVVNISLLSTGSDTGTIIPIKEIFKSLLSIKSNAFCILHNHPSGNLNFSEQDIVIAKKIREAGKLLDLILIDSLIITRESYLSMADEDLF